MKKMKPGGKQNSEENEDELDMGIYTLYYLKFLNENLKNFLKEINHFLNHISLTIIRKPLKIGV
jgi:hypothetical protein